MCPAGLIQWPSIMFGKRSGSVFGWSSCMLHRRGGGVLGQRRWSHDDRAGLWSGMRREMGVCQEMRAPARVRGVVIFDFVTA